MKDRTATWKAYVLALATDQRHDPAAFLLKGVLYIFSWLYRGVTAVRILCYETGLLKSVRLPKPVVSVGNIMSGGTGKTPLTVYCARYFLKRGLKPAILLRGYMENPGASESDEAEVLRELLPGVPIGVGADRVASAEKCLAAGDVDVFILDDGFQHLRVQRDLDIVVIDTVNPFGNGHVLPRGLLREPVARLKRADIIVASRADAGHGNMSAIEKKIAALSWDVVIAQTVHQVSSIVDVMSGKDCALTGTAVGVVCSIGNPEGFRFTVESQGARIVWRHEYPDHYVYAPEDIETILAECRRYRVTTVVTTQKDVVKMQPLWPADAGVALICVYVNLEFTKHEQEFCQRMDHISAR